MIQAYIEIEKYSDCKYELNSKLNILELDRPLNQSIPEWYGFIAGTMGKDGDELDCFVVSSLKLLPGSLVDVEVQSVLFCTDQGIDDHKLIVTVKGEREYNINPVLIENYLRTYKDGFVVDRLGTKEEALVLLEKSRV